MPSPILDLLESAADADGGILYEDREQLRLRYRSRATLYTQRPTLVLDYTEPGLAPPLEPTGDDDGVENDVTVTRANGSSSRAVLETGALSVQAPPAGVGPYPAQTTLNLHSDEQTEPIAYWRLHHGTYEGRRYPQVRVMVHATPPELLDQILAVDVGDKMVIRNPPRWVAPGDVELIVQGYEEVWASPFQWDITFNCTPAAPWNVALADDPVYGRADTDGSQLAAAAGATDTALMVRTTAGPAWPSNGSYPCDIRVGGEVMTVTAVGDSLADTFGRTVAGGWGTADSGQAWAVVGAAADYSVGAGYGVVTHPTVGIAHLTTLLAPGPDVDLYVDVSASALATGASLFTGPIARAVDNNNHYMARLELLTTGGITLTVRKRVAGTETSLGSYTSTLTHVTGAWYRVRFQVIGSSLRAKVWAATEVEPGLWQIEVTDSSLTAAARVGTRSFRNTGNTNTSVQLRFDNFRLAAPQRFTVQRAVNGVTKPHPAGTDVRLAHPAIVAL
jgi:hypothetical protein